MSERIFPNVRVRHGSPNYSARATSRPSLIVLHSTEGQNVKGLADLVGLGSWFANTGAQVSSHAATDADGQSARFVSDDHKAWHCAGYNSMSLGLEQVGRAAQSRGAWTEAQLRESARWLAWWSRKWGIPLQRGAVSNGVVTRPGVVMHSELGAIGGGHHDPGANYPLIMVLTHARRYRRLQDAHGSAHKTSDSGKKSWPPSPLKSGSKGSHVRRLQRLLNKIRNPAKSARQPVLKVDGDFGPATEQRVKQFQRHHGLAVDGIVGEKTGAKLIDASA